MYFNSYKESYIGPLYWESVLEEIVRRKWIMKLYEYEFSVSTSISI
jgi:hypothetical protein